MLLRLLAVLVLASFASTDKGVLIDPNGGFSALVTDQGSGIDPNGGGAMDPNGTANVGSGIDPDGVRLCYTGCVDPNG